MKYMLIILLLFSLNGKAQTKIISGATFKINTAMQLSQCDSLKRLCDSLRTQLFINKYKVERVRYYLNIAIRNPSQTKFLKSWISRAIK